MKCFSPSSVPDKRVKSSRVRITVPCGRCAACITNKRNDWASRLRIEARYSKSAYFITLTYSDKFLHVVDIPNQDGETIYRVPTLVKKDVQDFMKRLRKPLKEKIRYYLVGEYGERTHRPHYHMLLFNMPYTGLNLQKFLLEKWKLGSIDVGQVNPASIRYITNYMIQRPQYHNPFIEKPFALMSKGVGSKYLERHTEKHHQDLSRNYMIFEDGQKSRLPRYYREKIYCENTRIKQNEKAIIDGDVREKRNWEIWAEKNEGKNYFEYEVEQHVDYKRKVEKTLKNNAKL